MKNKYLIILGFIVFIFGCEKDKEPQITPTNPPKSITIVSGNRVTPTASVKLGLDDKMVLEAGIGVGPVDAAINAVNKGVKEFADVRLEEYHVDAITGGADALIDVIVKLRLGNNVISARSTQPDIINASVEAYIIGVNRLLEIEKKKYE